MRQNLPEQVQRQVLADGSPIRQWVGPITLAVAVGLAYFLAARLSLLLMSQPGVAVFWPAAGISSGTLIALGRATRWPVAIGVIAANIPANLTGDRNVLSSSIFSLSDAGEALLVAWMIERYIGSDFSLGRLRHVLGLLAAAIVGTAVSGVGGTLGYKLGYNPDVPAWTVWRQWIASDTVGIIAVAPLIVGLFAALRAPPSRRELVEGVAAVIVVAATAGTIIFMLPPDWWEMCVAVVLLFPVVLWVAARCRPEFASGAVFIVSLIVIATVTFKLGNFGQTAPSMDYSVISAQITIVGTAFCAFILSALFAERRQHEAVVMASETRLQEALRLSARFRSAPHESNRYLSARNEPVTKKPRTLSNENDLELPYTSRGCPPHLRLDRFCHSKLPMLRMVACGLRDIEDRQVFDPIDRRDRHMASPPRGSLLDDWGCPVKTKPEEPRPRGRAPVPRHRLARSALPRERFRCVLGMLSSSEVKVLRPT
jgi:integral membrane sensor domain MASE1